MITIIQNRGTGKAKKLLETAREKNATIIPQDKRAFEVKANDEEKRVNGYATTFDEPYTLYDDGEYEVREVIDAAH